MVLLFTKKQRFRSLRRFNRQSLPVLNTRTKKGNTLIDQLVSDGLIPEDNNYHYFNGKSLATFNTNNVIREVVYVETRVDSDKDGLPDLIKVKYYSSSIQWKDSSCHDSKSIPSRNQ